MNLFEEQSINEIVDLVKHGDTEAYSFLIKAFQKKIYLYCYYLLGNQEEAEDAAQDTFISGFNQIGQFFPTVSFAAWLYKIAHHRCMDVLKKKNRRFHLFKKYQQELTVSDQPSDRYSDYIHELLSSLNAEERRILLLRALEEYSFEEMSAILDIKPATLRKKYERLRKRLIKGKGGFHYEHAYKTNG
ncbi:sigma-70 family RNA polymerase sigma factor [Paenibacillus sacheonensis]|uniref:RNA polymerase sigma factor n=1 Tax=Paenibacillus sacheonensis TaxID=742054 RepID=UPI003083F333